MRTIRVFGHHFNLPLLLLSLTELAMAAAALLWGFVLSGRPELESGAYDAFVSGFASAALGLAIAAVGLYHVQQRNGFVGILLRLAVAFTLTAPLVLAVDAMLAGSSRPWAVGIGLMLAFIAVGAVHSLFFMLADAGALRRRVLVLGAGLSAASILDLRRRADRRGFEVVGFIPMEEASVVEPARRLISDASLQRLALAQEVDEVVVAMDDQRARLPTEELLACRYAGIDVVDIEQFMEREAGKVRLDLLRPSTLVFAGNTLHGLWQQRIKRAFDLTVSLVLLTLGAPLLGLAALAIRIEEGRHAPLFYRQQRVGRDGQVFELVKLRSMRVDAERDGVRWASRDDARVTRVGRLLRKSRLDELPQVFNVLHGDMSFVGPRPERPEFVEQLAAQIPWYRERHRVKPGITGWAQLMYPYGASREDAAEKLQYDLYYLKNQSLMLDLIILLQTVEVVLFGKGAR